MILIVVTEGLGHIKSPTDNLILGRVPHSLTNRAQATL